MLLQRLDLQLGLARLVQELISSTKEIESLIVKELCKAWLRSAKLLINAYLPLLLRLVEL